MSIGMHIARIGLPGNDPGEMPCFAYRMGGACAPSACSACWSVGCVLGGVALREPSRGFLAALVTGTCPMFSLIARQAMTDMAFVGPMTMALALGRSPCSTIATSCCLGAAAAGEAGPIHPLFYAAIGVFLLIVLPQLIVDSVQLKVKVPWGEGEVLMYGAVLMIPYYLGAGRISVFCGTRALPRPALPFTLRPCCAAGGAGQGLCRLGLASDHFHRLPLLHWNWKRLRRAQLLPAVLLSIVVVAVVAAPWHHAMIAKHGWAFWNELFGDNHWRRMMLGPSR